MRFMLTLLLTPLLLAPVRLPQGNESFNLPPSLTPRLRPALPRNQAPTTPRGGAAVALPAPTVIEVSPTRAVFVPLAVSATAPPSVATGSMALPSLVVSPTASLPAPAVTPPAPPLPNPVPPPEAATGMTPKQAALCVRSLGLVNDLAVVSMQQSGRDGLVDLTIAAAIGQVQAAQGVWPEVALLKSAGLPLFTPNRAELRQALTYASSFCSNPAASRGGSVGVARPR